MNDIHPKTIVEAMLNVCLMRVSAALVVLLCRRRACIRLLIWSACR